MESLKMVSQKKGALVKELEEMPRINAHDAWYLQCFVDLRPEMSGGFGLKQIPFASIVQWCHIHNEYDMSIIRGVVSVIRELEACEAKFVNNSTG